MSTCPSLHYHPGFVDQECADNNGIDDTITLSTLVKFQPYFSMATKPWIAGFYVENTGQRTSIYGERVSGYPSLTKKNNVLGTITGFVVKVDPTGDAILSIGLRTLPIDPCLALTIDFPMHFLRYST